MSRSDGSVIANNSITICGVESLSVFFNWRHYGNFRSTPLILTYASERQGVGQEVFSVLK